VRGGDERRNKRLPLTLTLSPRKSGEREYNGRHDVTYTRACRKAAEPSNDDTQRAADYVLEDQVGYLLRCAHQRATETFNAVMSEFSITPTQFAALAKLDDLQAVSQNQLGRLTAMDPATISGVIGRLTTRGYVQASPDPKDARVVMLGLTPAGKAAITAMKAVAADVSRKTLEPLTAAEAAALVSALAKIG
jgi:MarR family transcriptional regulator, lower aerobic nicotinate degradation pathway regulator